MVPFKGSRRVREAFFNNRVCFTGGGKCAKLWCAEKQGDLFIGLLYQQPTALYAAPVASLYEILLIGVLAENKVRTVICKKRSVGLGRIMQFTEQIRAKWRVTIFMFQGISQIGVNIIFSIYAKLCTELWSVACYWHGNNDRSRESKQKARLHTLAWKSHIYWYVRHISTQSTD